MKNQSPKNSDNTRRPGVVLLLTLVVLVVLATLGYTLSDRLLARRHRQQYMIDYQAARYACDSAAKYALATLETIKAQQLVSRPNEPDFSDLFSLSEEEYEQYIRDWAAEYARLEKIAGQDFNDVNGLAENDVNEMSFLDDLNYSDSNTTLDLNDPNNWVIRGPYGPEWPNVSAPIEFKIGTAMVKIEIQDENAKYPIGWAILDEPELEREIDAGLVTFCEWMSINDVDIETLKEQLAKICEIKPFKMEFKPIIETKQVKRKVSPSKSPKRGRRGRTVRRPGFRTKTVKTTIPASVHTVAIANLFHSSLLDSEMLARPTIESETRKESPLKYVSMWGSSKVNINTAPRQVLEAAFIFGGDEVEIAEEIVEERRIKPFKDIDELKTELMGYSDSIRACEKYITTTSEFFTIRVTATSGVAETSTVIAVRKQGEKLEKIAIISG